MKRIYKKKRTKSKIRFFNNADFVQQRQKEDSVNIIKLFLNSLEREKM